MFGRHQPAAKKCDRQRCPYWEKDPVEKRRPPIACLASRFAEVRKSCTGHSFWRAAIVGGFAVPPAHRGLSVHGPLSSMEIAHECVASTEEAEEVDIRARLSAPLAGASRPPTWQNPRTAPAAPPPTTLTTTFAVSGRGYKAVSAHGRRTLRYEVSMCCNFGLDALPHHFYA